jgi:hypothetical protein
MAPHWHKIPRCLPDFENLHTAGLSHTVPTQNKLYKSLNHFCICTPPCGFPVQTTWEHISKQQSQQPQSSVKTNHEAQLLLLYVVTYMWQNFQQGVWSVTALWLFVSSTSNITTLLWCKPSKVRDTVKAYIPSLVQRGIRDAAILIPDLDYRWRQGGHTTQSQFIPKKETRYSM